MIGYDQLLNLRRQRVQPSMLCITDGPDRMSRDWHLQVAGCTQQYHAHVEVSEQEIPESLDLRAAIGLVVMVSGERGVERTRRLFECVVKAQPLAAIAALPTETLFFDSRVHGKHSHS